MFRLGALSIRRTLATSRIRSTGAKFGSSFAENGEANDWRLMWLQKNNHSGPEGEFFKKEGARYTKVGFPLRFYKHLRTLNASPSNASNASSATVNSERASTAPATASQFINHFPGSEALDNKASMAFGIREGAKKHPEAFATGFVHRVLEICTH